MRRLAAGLGPVLAALALGVPALAHPTTVGRTIQDRDGDNRLEFAPGESHVFLGDRARFRAKAEVPILNFIQLSDFQMVDEESPGRVEFLDATQRDPFTPFASAYRPQEALTTQITEAMVRALDGVRSPFTGAELDLAILTGDNADSQQYNETRWFIDILDGDSQINPDSGIPTPECPHSQPGSVYDGVRGGGSQGFYEPDASGPGVDGDGYSPNRSENQASVGKDVTVRDFPGLFEAANKTFHATGLTIPWYSAFGNHDALVQGNSPDAFFGPFGETGERSNPAYQGIVTGCLKPRSDSGDPPPRVVPPDPKRCFLAKDEPGDGAPAPCDKGGWIDQHFATTGVPVGHGFALSSSLRAGARAAGYGRPASADANNDGYYSFPPAAGLRFVVLDTVTDECGSIFCSEGSLDDTQFGWLQNQIELAERTRQYVIVFSHHTLRTTFFPSTDPTEQPIHNGLRVDREAPDSPAGTSPATTLEELYCLHPNVIAHIAGHEHENYVRHHTCTKEATFPTPGEGDFWHISTAAHVDWPQQSRMVELMKNPDGTFSMALTVLDHASPPNPGSTNPASGGWSLLKLASIGRELAYNDYHNGRQSRGTRRDRNVVIVFSRPWPAR